jgi:DHA2 family multidrug resistance protein-like MFS transporter
MLAHFWWGSVFLLGVPAMVLLLVLGPVLLPEYRNPSAGRLDLVSVALSLAAILPFIYGLKELARHGWQPLPVIAVVVGAAFAVWFARRQKALADPLLDLRLFTNPQFSISLGGLLSCSMLSGATMVFVAQHFQLVDGLSPLQAGLALLPGMVTSILSVQVAPLLARRIRPAYLIGAGLAVMAIGMVVITQSGPADGPTTLIIGFAIACLGGGPLVALGTNLVMSSVPPHKAGSASGVVQTNSEFGYALGIAVIGSLGTFAYRTQVTDDLPAELPAPTADAARESLTGAITVAGDLPANLGAAVLDAARNAFSSGLHTAAAIAAVVQAGMAILIITRLRGVRPLGQTETPTDQPETPDANPTPAMAGADTTSTTAP